MTKISRDIRTDKRSHSVISATVHSTIVNLSYNNLVIKLSKVEAKRLAETLTKAVAIQDTHIKDSKSPLPLF